MQHLLRKRNFIFNRTNLASLVLLGLTAPISINAQTSELVITQTQAKQAEAILDNQILEENINLENTGRATNFDFTNSESTVPSYKNANIPIIKSDNTGNVDFTIGAIAQDSADSLTARDPYDIENLEQNPIYPEGYYVDEMRASAGLDLSSKF